MAILISSATRGPLTEPPPSPKEGQDRALEQRQVLSLVSTEGTKNPEAKDDPSIHGVELVM